jgi:hypothetical protein
MGYADRPQPWNPMIGDTVKGRAAYRVYLLSFLPSFLPSLTACLVGLVGWYRMYHQNHWPKQFHYLIYNNEMQKH